MSEGSEPRPGQLSGPSLSLAEARALAECAFAAGASRGNEAAIEVLRALQAVTHHDAAAVLAWDPFERTHRVVGNLGYDESTLDGLGDRYAESEPHARMRHDRLPLRIDDLPYDYRATEMYHQVIEPAGFGDGMTAVLFAGDGGYSGMIHLSAERRETFHERYRSLIAALAPSLGEMANLRRYRSTAASAGENSRANLVDHAGRVWPVDQYPPTLCATHANFARFASHFLATSAPSACGVWPSNTGWLSVQVERVRDPMLEDAVALLIIETPWEAPYGLSARELDVLNGLAQGASNQRIASERAISVRTVTTHVERILVKLGQESRAGAASKASREGLLRLDMWPSEAGARHHSAARSG